MVRLLECILLLQRQAVEVYDGCIRSIFARVSFMATHLRVQMKPGLHFCVICTFVATSVPVLIKTQILNSCNKEQVKKQKEKTIYQPLNLPAVMMQRPRAFSPVRFRRRRSGFFCK